METRTIIRGYIDANKESVSQAISSCVKLDELYIKGPMCDEDWRALTNRQPTLTRLDLSDAYFYPSRKLNTSCQPLPGSKIESITLPKDLRKIDGIENPVFDGFRLPFLQEITIDSANSHFRTKDGCLYSYDYSILYAVPAGRYVEFEIKPSVKYLALCFFRNAKLQVLKVPETPPQFLSKDARRTFAGIMPNLVDLIVPHSAFDVYRQTDVWKDFNIIPE